MATHSCITPQWSNAYTPQVRLDIAEQSATDNTMTLAWSLVYVAHNRAASTNGYGRPYTVVIDGKTVADGTFNINGIATEYLIKNGTTTITRTKSNKTVSFSCSFNFNVTWAGVYGGTKSASGSFSVPPISTWRVSYNANGGAGAPGAQTKWYGETLKLSAVKPVRTGYSFKGWSTGKDNTVEYAAGANYTANASVTLYAVWTANTYKVTYNANGGTGAPGAQTKTYGVTLKLSSTKPTRTNYNFKGWGTSASSTTVAYAAGANYTANSAITLYAVWELAYTLPRITNAKADRCTSNGTLKDDGTYAKVTFNWACDRNVKLITVGYGQGEDPQTVGKKNPSASGKSGSVSIVIGDNNLNVETEYSARITVQDEVDSLGTQTRIPAMEYIMDIRKHGITLGGPASEDGFHVKYSTEFENTVQFSDRITGQIKRKDPGTMWYAGRDNAIIRNEQSDSGSSDGWYPVISSKSSSASWEIGSNKDRFVISRVADAKYNKKENTSVRFAFNLASAPINTNALDYDLFDVRVRSGNGDWLGFYEANSLTRKSWVGNDGTTTLKLVNDKGGNIETNTALILANNKPLYGKKTDGTNAIIGYISSSNNLAIGSSTASNTSGDTSIYAGADITICAGRNKSVKTNFFRAFSEQTGSERSIFRCDSNGGGYLGTTTYRWNTGFFTNAITASDLKEKDVINDFDFKVEDFIMGLTPIAYRRKGSGDTGRRVHMGFGAQHVAKIIEQIGLGDMSIVNASITKEVEKTMINDDGIEEKILERQEFPYDGTEEVNDENLTWGLNYNEFIAPIVLILQKQQKEILDLKREIYILKKGT